jgi:hypothetical protein
VKNAGVPYSDGEFAVVADIGYWRYSMPYPADVSMLRCGPIGPEVLCGIGAYISGFGMYGECSGWIMNEGIGFRSIEKSIATGTDRLRWRL